MKIFGKVIVTMIIGLLYVGCKTDSKVVPVSNSRDIKPESEATNNKEEVYDHFSTSGLAWLPIEKLKKPQASGSKMYLIDIYTEWCGWCKMMDRKTFSDSKVQKRLEKEFNLIKLNAEAKTDIEFDGEQYKWRGSGSKGIHELAAKLMKGKIEYPTLIFLDENLKTIRVSRGYKNPDAFLQEIEMAVRS